jgi:NAD(P)-dependent dehydrogenase (short-subunit alcohol dehydrogenase family)
MTSQGTKSWLITGCSTGFGRSIATAALARGDRVLLTGLETATLPGLASAYPRTALARKLDVTQEADVGAAVEAMRVAFGGVDVLVNNAGITRAGAVEESARDEYRPLYETNLFGAAAMTRAVLPMMRAQGSGCIVNMSSAAGLLVNAGMGHYGATKFALEALSEALAAEIGPLGIRVLIVEPGLFRTNIGASFSYARDRIDAYRETAHKTFDAFHEGFGRNAGDPDKAAIAILKAVDTPDAPLRLPLGEGLVDRIKDRLAGIVRNLDQCAEIAGQMKTDRGQ